MFGPREYARGKTEVDSAKEFRIIVQDQIQEHFMSESLQVIREEIPELVDHVVER